MPGPKLDTSDLDPRLPDPHRPPPRRSPILGIGIVTFGVLGISILINYLVGVLAIDSSQRVAARRAILQDLENVISSLKDAETGQRGYLLTGDELYLAPFQKALPRMDAEKEALRRWASAGELRSPELEALLAKCGEKLAEIDRTIHLRREGRPDAALEVVRAGKGKAIMDEIRVDALRMSTALTASIEKELRQSYIYMNLRTVSYIAMGVFCVLVLVWAFRRLAIEIRRNEAATLEVREEKELLRTTLASIGDGVIVTDATGRISFLNAQAERLTRWKNSDAAGQSLPTVFRIIDELTRTPAENPVDKVLRLGTVVGLANHTLLIARDGTELPINDSGAPIRNPGGPLSGVVLVFRDASDQRKAERIRARLATIVESSGDAILSKNLEGTILTCNGAAQRMFGYGPEEIIGKPVTILIPPELQKEEEEILDRVRQGLPYHRLETVRVAKDGRRLSVSLSVSPIKDAEGRVIGASKILHDISDLLAAREALEREKDLLHTTLTSIGDGVIVTDQKGQVSLLNAEAERLTGWTSADARGQDLPTVFRIINEDSRNPVENPVDKVLRLGTVVGLANHTVLIGKDGKETPIDDSAAPIRSPGGPLSGVVLVFRDFTEQKKAQEAISKMNSDLERRVAGRTRQLQETIQELETFSYTVAHDLRGPLRAMHRSAEVLLMEQSAALTEEGCDFLRRIAKSATRMDTLIQDLLAYSRVTRAELKSVPVEPRGVLADLLVHLAPEIQERQAEVRVEAPLPRLLADPVLLNQAFANLLSNALKFVPQGRPPRVKIRAERHNGMERIWVEDNGIGIDTRFRERLFRIFERLDSDYPGTGIGLAIVRRAVERMGGHVGFESREEGGSRFWIELPSAEKA